MHKIKISNETLITVAVYQDSNFIGHATHIQLLDVRVQCKENRLSNVHIEYINKKGKFIKSRIDKNGTLEFDDLHDIIGDKYFKLV